MTELKITDVRAHPGDSAFLLDDGQTAILYDSGFAFTGYAVAENIRAVLGERKLDYIFLTHSHYDHALGSAYVRKFWPEVQVVAGEYAVRIFQKPSARQVMRELDRKFAKKCGITDYEDRIDDLTVDIPVRDGDTVPAGSMQFTAVELPGHTRCSMGFYLPERRLLLGTETLGVYDGDQTIVPAYLVGYRMALASMEKARKLDIQQILLPHFGLVSQEKAHFYLENCQKSAEETGNALAQILRSGGTKAEAADWFRNRFYHGYIQTVYPPDAMSLNTGIMVNLIEKELCASL